MKRLGLLAAIGVAGCAPHLVSGNEVGGIASVRGTVHGQRQAMELADAHCRKYGRLARYEGTNEFRGTLRFDCVKP